MKSERNRASQAKSGIKIVTIEMENGTEIRFCPSWPSLPVQIIKKKWSGQMEAPIEMSVTSFMELLERIKGGNTYPGPNYCGA